MTAALPSEQVLAAHRCASCPKMCRGSCPTLAVTANERHQPWGHARGAEAALADPRGFSTRAAVANAYACATCAACTVDCQVEGVETPDLAWAVRAAVHAAGATPAVGRRAVAEALAGRVLVDTDPPRWDDPGSTLEQLRRLATPGADLLLWPGCGALGRRPGAVLAAGRALAALGVPFTVLDRQVCCGMPGLTFGDAEALDRMLLEAAEAVREAGVREVAVQSPSCASLLAVRAPRRGSGLDAEVVNLASVLAAAMTDRDRPDRTVEVAYHDPCHLSRHQTVTAQPRAALRGAGMAVVELQATGLATACSGQGGGLPLTHPALAAGYLARLRAQLGASGAPAVVTGCASCATALESADPDGTPVYELAEAVAAALEGRGR